MAGHKNRQQCKEDCQIKSVTIYIDEHDHFQSIYVYLRQDGNKKETIESKGPLDFHNAVKYIENLIQTYQLDGETLIVDTCFDQVGNVVEKLEDTVSSYLTFL